MSHEIDNSPWGSLSVSAAPDGDSSTTDGPERARLVWRPPSHITSNLPENFSIELTQYGGVGNRRFVPSIPEGFVPLSALAGFAFMTNGFDAQTRRSFREMHLVFQHASRVREALVRSFSRRQDLLIEKVARIEVDQNNILPSHLGLDISGTGKRWTVERLMDAGRAAAPSHGFDQPREADLIRVGVLEAARRNPVNVASLTKEDATRWLRTVLFDLGSAERPHQEVYEEVVGRFLDALECHVALSDAEFRTWFIDKRDGIIHQISKKKSGGILVPRESVRQILLELTFESLCYVGQCVARLMRNIANLVQPPLTEHEQHIFDSIYGDQDWLGGIPLMVIRPYLDAVREAFLELLEDPANGERRGTLLRALELHASMVQNKRKAERERKRTHGIRRQGGVELDSFQLPHNAQRSRLNDVVAILGYECEKCNVTDYEYSLDMSSETDLIEAMLICRRCGTSRPVTLAIDELKRAGAELFRDS